MNLTFSDRMDAGRRLAEKLDEYAGTDAVVVGLARGGVVVGAAVARALDLPLQVLVVRKLGAPGNPELAIGAVSETGERWLDRRLIEATHASEEYVDAEIAAQVEEARRRQQRYAIGPGLETIAGRTAIVVDDGIATGATALVALQSARKLGAKTVVLATPVASRPAVRLLEPHADRMVVLATPDPFLAVGFFYDRFEQVSDAEVIALRAGHRGP